MSLKSNKFLIVSLLWYRAQHGSTQSHVTQRAMQHTEALEQKASEGVSERKKIANFIFQSVKFDMCGSNQKKL